MEGVMDEISSKNTIVEILNKLGLEEREAEVYLCLLENGPMLPQRIAIKTGIKRTTLYDLFPIMIREGTIMETLDGKRRAFQAVPPQKLVSNYESRYKEIKASVAELLAVYRMQGLKPEIEVYEGFEGAKKVYLDALKTIGEILVVNQIAHYDKKFLNWVVSEFVPARIRANIKVRALSEDTEAARHGMKSEEKLLRETRHVPFEKFKFRMELMIYNDKVAFVNIEKASPLVGIVIKSPQISTTLRALFDLAWEGADSYQKISNS